MIRENMDEVSFDKLQEEADSAERDDWFSAKHFAEFEKTHPEQVTKTDLEAGRYEIKERIELPELEMLNQREVIMGDGAAYIGPIGYPDAFTSEEEEKTN